MISQIANKRGQMTVELVVCLPAALLIALISVNALTFFSECAAFDRQARNAIRVVATSPGYGQDTTDSVRLIEQALGGFSSVDNLECRVSAHSNLIGLTRYEAELTYHFTLFGLGMKREFFGVALPALTHRVSLEINSYKPGMLF